MDVIMIVSLWNLTDTSAVLLPRCLSNLERLEKSNPEILQLREFTGSCGKTPVRLVNRGHGAPGSKLASSSGSESLVVGTNPKCEIETLFIQFEFLNEDYVVGGIYRHPNGNTAHFIDDLETAIGKLKDNVTVILAGDINIDIIKFENEKTMAYLTTLLSNRFFPFITLPTRITDFSATCIDHIFVKPGGHVKQNISEIYSGIFYCDISDHLPCFLSLKGKNCSTKYTRPKTRIFGDRNCRKFVNLMESENWDDMFTEDTDWYTKFIQIVRGKFENSFPLVQVSRKRMKDKPWITKGLKNSIQKCHRLYKQTFIYVNIHTKEAYKRYKNLLRKCLRIAENIYYMIIFDDAKQSVYALWKNLGPVINPGKKKRSIGISKLLFQGQFTKDPHEIANNMNKHFCEIGMKLQQTIPQLEERYTNYLPGQIENSFFLAPTNSEEVLKEISNLN